MCIKCIELEKKLCKNAEVLVYNKYYFCKACKQSYSPGIPFKIHFDKIYCIQCYIDILKTFDTEKVSQFALEGDIYDYGGNRLCDIKACNIYSPNLNNAFKGFFCHKHYEDMKIVRKIIKETTDIVEEYNMRLWEINNRKRVSINHICYINMLNYIISMHRYDFDPLYDQLPSNLDFTEAEYINNLFAFN